jgi:hypothetical protein
VTSGLENDRDPQLGVTQRHATAGLGRSWPIAVGNGTRRYAPCGAPVLCSSLCRPERHEFSRGTAGRPTMTDRADRRS